MPRKPDLPCNMCGNLMQRTAESLPEGKARCHPCRRAAQQPRLQRKLAAPKQRCGTCGSEMTTIRKPGHGEPKCHPCRRLSRERICPWCEQPFRAQLSRTKYCSIQCANKHKGLAQMVRAEDDQRVLRWKRESVAPGLSYSKRKRLLRTWMRQGRACAYCPARATTIDHVLPLVRGGTNYEGNLTPCCKSCNSSKGGLTLVEWRTGLRLPRMTTPLQHHARVRVAKVKPVRLPRGCAMCSSPTLRPKYCGQPCAAEAQARYMRDKYRRKVGIPVDGGPVANPRTRTSLGFLCS